MPNAMVALSNTGGALCSTAQSLADAHYWSAVQKRCRDGAGWSWPYYGGVIAA